MGLFGIDFGDPLGAKANKRANAANEARYQQALGMFDSGEPGIMAAYLGQRQGLQAAQGEIQRGYKQAQGSLSLMGERGRQDVRDTSAQALGQGSQQLLQRGLGTSSRLGGLARGIAAGAQRGAQAVNEGVSGAQATLQASQGERLANLQSLLGSSFVNQNQALNAWRRGKIDTIASRQDVAGPGWLSQAANIAGGIGGLMGGL